MGKRNRLRKATCWLVVAALVLPALALVALNIALATPWLCNKAANHIHHRVHLETRIGRISVWPWRGITVEGLQMLQPAELLGDIDEPVLEVRRMVIRPYWKPLLSKQLSIRELVLEEPRVVIAAEMLASLMPTHAPPVATPPLAQLDLSPPTNSPETPPSSAPTAPPVTGSDPVPPDSPTPAADGTPAPPAPSTPAAPATPARPTATPPPPPVAMPTVWCRIRNASVTLCSATLGSRAEIRDIHGDFPLSGADATSSLRIGSCAIGNQHHDQPIEIPINWKTPQLTIGSIRTTIAGLDTEAVAAIGLQRGMPCHIRAHCPTQSWQPTHLPANARANISQLTTTASFYGLLAHPSTWQGQWVARTTGNQLQLPPHTSNFNDGFLHGILRGGTFAIDDARLIGDEASLLGNGTLHADGRYAASLRLVAHPRDALAVAKHLFPDLTTPIPLTPLSTPQRAAFDLEARGKLGHLSLTIGHGGPIIDIHPQSPNP